ncbi:hypothetical protein [Lelliottia sp. WAP21]|uniref:hypothetical protein n=1 Tax=Lelliottia sp. WAP21 TaxID=2877426 RepID=UPI001E38935D|nr:hypothetical protein [Lelliottia sp. WAP21]
MAAFEEVQAIEGMYAPLDVRRDLRQMFARWLPKPSHFDAGHGAEETIDEQTLLELCVHYRLEFPGDAEDIERFWDELPERLADGGPAFDELARQGWVFSDGCRWVMQGTPVGTRALISYPSPSTQTFLQGLSVPRLVPRTDAIPPSIQMLADKILDKFLLEQSVPLENPDWFLSRLWEHFCQRLLPQSVKNEITADQGATCVSNVITGPLEREDDATAVDNAFREWSSWCYVVQGFGKWDTQWTSTERQWCREAAHRVLERQKLWGKWDTDLTTYASVLHDTYAIPLSELRFANNRDISPPKTSVARAGWLASREIEHLILARFMMQRHGPNAVNFAFGVLCSELERTDISSSIKAAAGRLLSFAAEHPMALLQLKFRVDAEPELLVDMLLHPHTACLAAKWTLEWQLKSGRTSDRFREREAQTKTYAIQDALSFIAYHLADASLDPEEYASLITWCYTDSTGIGRAIVDSRKPVGQLLLGMIAKQNKEVQSQVLSHLVGQAAYKNNIPRARFAGALDGLDSFPHVAKTQILPLITLYSTFAHELNLDWTDVAQLSSRQARWLVAVACEQDETVSNAFLIPFDGRKLIAEASADDELIIRSSVARTLRIHVRLLSRAVSAWHGEEVPPVLCDALKWLVSRSVVEHDEKGRIGALTDRYSPSHFLSKEAGSPAQDLAAAWRTLDSANQEALLQAVALSDDPVLLAELCQFLPAEAKGGIKARLRQLKPEEASTFWTWPEIQHRIESLLAADEYALAREHLESIREELGRSPQQYRLALFGLELQLLIKEEHWVALDNTILPPGMDAATARRAEDQLDFYKATSELLRPGGNLVNARAVLQRLSSQPGASDSFRENFYAVAVQQLTGSGLKPLKDANKTAGEALLAEMNHTIAGARHPVSNNLLANRGILLLALQRPDDALDSVYQRRREVLNPDLEILVVLAKYEMGRHGEAMAILDAAISEFSNDKRLLALKEDLDAGNPAQGHAAASVDIDFVSSIRVALQHLAELPPSLVGNILGPPDQGVRGYLIRQVSRAVATLPRMAGMLRGRKNPANEAKLENDLNTAVREVLGASLAVAKWDVADQSLGGTTASGNPGERDAVIRISGQELSVYEALVCESLDRTNFKKHFDKLLSYGTCDLYFHVIYSYAEEIQPILDYVRSMLEHESPPSLTYLNCSPLMPPDIETSGYLAIYRVDHREVAIAFLIADLKTRV